MEKVKGIILKTNKYKDNDVIVSLLTSDGQLLDATLRGASKIENKNHELTYNFLVGEFELYKANLKHFQVKCGSIKHNLYEKLSDDFDHLNIYSYLSEISSKFPPISDYEKYYLLYDLTIENLIKQENKYFYLLLFLLAEVRLAGYNLNFDDVNFDKTYVSFNYQDLVFYDSDANNEGSVSLTKDLALVLRKLSINKYRDNEKEKLNELLSKTLISFLTIYISSVAEIKIYGLI